MTEHNIESLIEATREWGFEKGILGPNGKGTKEGQVGKMMEEATETFDAVMLQNDESYMEEGIAFMEKGVTYTEEDIKDGIGDTVVTLILLADMYGWTLQECLQHAYDVISKRTGKMEGGMFIKDK